MTTRRRDESEETETPAEGRIHELVERGKEVFEDQKDHAEEILAETRRYVKKHPGRSVLIAAGLGFVIGALWGRRS